VIEPRPFVDPRTLLGRYQLKPKRSFGQNFLVAQPIVEKIAALCVLGEGALVVEIGAGLGTLTSALLGRGARVFAIERDRELVPVLERELAADVEAHRLTIVEDDAAQVDLAALLSSGTHGSRVLAGNLPYQITGKLIERATELGRQVDRVVVMVQREVADRLVAPADGENYGQLSVFAQAAFDVKRELLVSAGCFHPRPEVESAVVVMVPRAVPRAAETPAFRAVVHAAFGARRKTLKNALAALIGAPLVRAAVEATGIDLGRRGETLSVEEFAQLAGAVQRGRAV
jgi:16S rRNA (adenine1518-N6/adenine1519-N6)-dimethyltransferase